MLVKDYMTSNPVVIEKDTPIGEAKKLLDENCFRHLPVVNGGSVVGVLSDRDVNRSIAIATTVKSFCDVDMEREMTAGEIMIENPFFVGMDSPLKDAAGIMFEKKIGCLPVLSDGRIVGIITETDILRIFLDMVKAPVAV